MNLFALLLLFLAIFANPIPGNKASISGLFRGMGFCILPSTRDIKPVAKHVVAVAKSIVTVARHEVAITRHLVTVAKHEVAVAIHEVAAKKG